jgi:N,N-dimethylformamidase beta subunit-like, C-terminal/Putative Ig domain/D-glucuronyl C5-epimerase, beta-sandwich domain
MKQIMNKLFAPCRAVFSFSLIVFFFVNYQTAHAAAIEGYLSAFSVTQGQSIDIHTSTSDPTFSIEIFKINNAGNQLVLSIPDLTGILYSTPADAWLGANWPSAHTLTIPTSWESGLYLIKLQTVDSYSDLSVIVKEDQPGTSSDILVFDNSPTWVAYNNWGGKSLYPGSSTSSEPAPTVSIKRPKQNVFRAEILELRSWLEHENISVEYASMFDLHNSPALLNNYNVVMLVGHSEYWSRDMRTHFDNFVTAGGNAIILSGNTLWWQIRIEGDLLVCYRSDYQNDPLYNVNNTLVTSNWFDTPINEPENSSIGVSWRNGGFVNYNGFFTEADGHGGYTTVNTEHWIYDGTTLADGDTLGYGSTIVGYEADGAEVTWIDNKPVVNGNDGTPLNFVVLGYAQTYPGLPPPTQNLATMGIFQAPNNGGFVFNAATIDWADGLWSLDYNTVADYDISQMTYNVINAFSNTFYPLSISTLSLPNLIGNSSYSTRLRQSGGDAPYTWTVSSGNLPTGLTLQSNTGEIHGATADIGLSTFEITVTDQQGASASTTYTVETGDGLVYENAEDGLILGWAIYDTDPAGASINNIVDANKNSRVIEFIGTGVGNGFRLHQADGSDWQNTEQFFLEWSMQLSAAYTIFVDVETSAGHRYLQFTASDNNNLGTGEYVHHGLGASTINGQWQTFKRDLQADLEAAQPGIVLQQVNAFLIRGSGRVDDITLLSTTLPLLVDTVVLPNPLLNSFYSQFIHVSGGQGPYNWSISNGNLPAGLTLNNTTGELSGSATNTGSFSFEVTITDAAGSSISSAFTVAVDDEIIYEDAQDGTVLGWTIYDGDPPGATINNVFDQDKGSQVIELSGTGTSNGFRLNQADGSNWQNNGYHILEWSMLFSESYILYVDVQTSAGHRYLQYTASDSDTLGTGEIVHHGLGLSSINGQWQSYIRDLQADLEEAQPGVIIQQINGLLIRGSGRLDDIKLSNNPPPLLINTQGLPSALLNNSYSQFVEVSGGVLPYNWSISNGSLPVGLFLNNTSGELSGTATQTGSSSFDVLATDAIGDSTNATFVLEIVDTLVYEDAEDGTVLGWTIYDNNPGGAAVQNVYDAVNDSRVIELVGSGTDNGFVLRQANGSSWQNSEQSILQWSMRTSSQYTIYLDVQTSVGHRYLQYTASNSDFLGSNEYIHHGLGAASINGQWQTFSRDLQADLKDAQPGVSLQEVNGLLIRGNGSLDDIKLLDNTLPLNIDTEVLPGALINNNYSEFIQVSGGDAPYNWSISNGSLPVDMILNSATGEISGMAINMGSSSFEVSITDASANTISADYSVQVDNELVYEDAEDGAVLGWVIYDNTPAGAAINNVFDVVSNSQVIELIGAGADNGFRLYQADGSNWQNIGQFTIEWSMQLTTLYTLYVDVETTAGHRYLQYTASDSDALGTGEYVHHGLGAASIGGQWLTITRDLQTDLDEAQPGVVVTQVNGFLIRGSGRLDDIKLKP